MGGALEATPRPHLTDFSSPLKEVSRSLAVNEGSRGGGGSRVEEPQEGILWLVHFRAYKSVLI